MAAFKAAARNRASPGDVSHEITLPSRFTRTVTVIVPETPAVLALMGYSALGSLISVPARGPPVTGRSTSGFTIAGPAVREPAMAGDAEGDEAGVPEGEAAGDAAGEPVIAWCSVRGATKL